MAAGTLPKPGTHYGPCESFCEHRDCAETIAMASTPCRICGECIGYDTRFYLESESEVRPRALVHADEAEDEIESQRYWPTPRPGLEKNPIPHSLRIGEFSRDARRKALFEKAPVCMICAKPIRTVTTAVLWTTEGGVDALVHGSNGSDCYMRAVRVSVDRYRATPRKAVS